jgi:trehalose/maltose hydrolase-like predicted phosphorylase
VVNGLAGVRTESDRVHIDPKALPGWTSLCFSIRHRGARLRIAITEEGTTVDHLEGPPITVVLGERDHSLESGGSARGPGAPAR